MYLCIMYRCQMLFACLFTGSIVLRIHVGSLMPLLCHGTYLRSHYYFYYYSQWLCLLAIATATSLHISLSSHLSIYLQSECRACYLIAHSVFHIGCLFIVNYTLCLNVFLGFVVAVIVQIKYRSCCCGARRRLLANAVQFECIKTTQQQKSG